MHTSLVTYLGEVLPRQQFIFDMQFNVLSYHQIKAALVPDIWTTTQKTSVTIS